MGLCDGPADGVEQDTKVKVYFLVYKTIIYLLFSKDAMRINGFQTCTTATSSAFSESGEHPYVHTSETTQSFVTIYRIK